MKTAMCSPLIEGYFTKLESSIGDLPRSQRDDFLMELRAHVMDRLEQVAIPSEEDCRAILNALGTPDEIARQLRMETILKRSSWRISPIVIMRACLRWTVAGAQGYIVLVTAIVGYLTAAVFAITALLKPVFPNHIGVFVGRHGVQLTQFPAIPPGHEILGSYYIPAALLVGYLFTLGTTMLIRSVIRHGRSLRQRLA
jgi:uncharacterized membrane protein